MSASIKFDTETIRSINLFEEITGVEVMDAITHDDKAYFVVEEGKVGLAIGKGGETIKKVQRNLDRDVKVYEYSDSLKEFVENLVPADVSSVKYDRSGENKVVKIGVDRSDWSRVVGKDGRNIDIIKRFLKREFDVDDVKVE
ncbi:MAG: NusA-like transcription termination signal-binding factor [Candidatus Nanohaloarchaea archaeon]|nr:NusA-like transcription termination signal-binding factor [Candidatus Nanohaloarchaea archaeon]